MSWSPARAVLALALVAIIAGIPLIAMDAREAGERRSGSFYLSEETRRLQDDEFLNPGMFAVERGRELVHVPRDRVRERPDGGVCRR